MNSVIVQLECTRLNATAGPHVEAKMAEAWSSGATVAALDFSKVAYIDSMGLSVLISAHRKRPAGARIVLCSLNDYVREVLEITQLVRVFDVYASADAVRNAA
jgi:anti-sigma B factor antagonist